MDVHPLLDPLRFLIGTWRGSGSGRYPTIATFEYEEEITFSPGPGKPFLAYSQRTRRAVSLEPLHAESGYLRALGSGRVELVIAQPTGIVEVLAGSVDGSRVAVTGTAHVTPTARPVSATTREIEVVGDVLRSSLAMEAVGRPLQHHLSAELSRAGSR